MATKKRATSRTRSKSSDISLRDVAVQLARGGSDKAQELVLKRELLAATESVLNAKDFDTKALVARLRKGTVTIEECRVAAALLDETMKRDKARPAEFRVQLKRDLAKRVIHYAIRSKKSSSYIVELLHTRFGKDGLSHTVIDRLIRERKEVTAKRYIQIALKAGKSPEYICAALHKGYGLHRSTVLLLINS